MKMEQENMKNFVKEPLMLYLSIALVLALIAGAFIYFRGDTFGDDYIVKVDETEVSANLYRHALLIAKEKVLLEYPNSDQDALWSFQETDDSPVFAREIEEFELNKLIKTAVINNLFEEYGLELTAAQDELRAQNVAARIEGFGGREAADELFKKYYLTYEDFVGFYEDYDRFELLFLHYFGVDGLYPVSFEEIDEYYEDNHARIKSILIPLVGSQGEALSAEATQEAMDLAVVVQEEASRPDSNFDELIKRYNKDVNLPEDGYVISRDYNTVPEFASAAFTMKEGEVKTILTDHGYYIMKKYSALDPSVYTNIERQQALLTMRGQAFNDQISDAKNKAAIVRNEDLIEQIKIEDITTR